MEPIQVRFHMVKEERDKGLKTRIKTISALGTKYAFPPEEQDEGRHPELFKIPIVKNCCKGMSKPGQFRNINVTLPQAIVSLYFDEEKNVVFNNIYLEEKQEIENNSASSSTSYNKEEELLKLISTLTTQLEKKKQINLTDIKNLFILENFQGKEKAEKWICLFEQECERHHIETDERKIQILRLFMEESTKEWYNSMLIRYSIKEPWTAWRNSFIKSFPDNTWDNVYYAFKFHYINGSLTEYALKKERLLLEVDPEMRMKEIINHTVVGLPTHIRDNLDKGEIVTMEILINKLGKYSKTCGSTDKRSEPTKNNKSKKDFNISEKRPCVICEKLGKFGRFHPVEICRNKEKKIEKESRSVNNVEYDLEEDQKNV